MGILQQSFGNSLGSLVDAFSHKNRIRSLINSLQTVCDHGLCENSRCCRTVTGTLICVVGYFVYQLSAHVFELVFQFDFLGDRDTVICDER